MLKFNLIQIQFSCFPVIASKKCVDVLTTGIFLVLENIFKIFLLIYEIHFDSLQDTCRLRYAIIGQGRPS